MVALEDSTQHLLNSYASKSASAASSSRSRDEDDISLFSFNHENGDFSSKPDLSDLYELLDDDSIEIRRSSNGGIVSTPLKLGVSPLRFSPTKKIRNDYQEHILRARSANNSNNNSPVKKKKGQQYENADLSYNDSSFDSFDGKIDQFLRANETNKRNSFRKELFVPDDDKTELIIRETHKIINSLPNDNEKYFRILRSSVDTMADSLSKLKDDNRILQSDNDTLRTKNEYSNKEISDLMQRNQRLSRENAELQSQLDQLRRQKDQQVPQYNSQLQRENDMLRQKLIKYKNLYLETKEIAEKKKIETETAPVVKQASKESDNVTVEELEKLQKRLVELLNKSNDLHERKEEKNGHSNQQHSTLPIFDELIDSIKGESKNTDRAGSGSFMMSNAAESTNDRDDLLQKVLNSLESNKRLYTAIVEAASRSQIQGQSKSRTQVEYNEPVPSGANSSGLAESLPSSAGEELNQPIFQASAKVPLPGSEFVVKCYACSRDSVPSSSSQGCHGKKEVDSTCKRCSLVSKGSSELDWNKGSDTVNLMGEYQWSI
ncbi:hypothetical protein G9P44_000540 [Scheffersomyces stipitis]|nr:hypothetical protein G9P44_000540 [Scheffersomyces stipitis]